MSGEGVFYTQNFRVEGKVDKRSFNNCTLTKLDTGTTFEFESLTEFSSLDINPDQKVVITSKDSKMKGTVTIKSRAITSLEGEFYESLNSKV